MQVQNISGFRFLNLPLANNKQDNLSRYNLRMQSPLSQDTVSFGCAQSGKTMADRSLGITTKLAKELRKMYASPHEKLKRSLLKYMGEILTTECQIKYYGGVIISDISKGLITMKDRIKGENSLCEKSASLSLDSKKEVLANIKDISGFCFILEDKFSFREFTKRFCSMIEDGVIDPIEIEYHRRAPKIRKGRVEESYDSLDIGLIEKIKNAVIKTKNPTTQFCTIKDSISGYSGLHITVRNSDGTFSEIQIQLRGVHELKDKAENTTYKVRNRKVLAPEYDMLAKILAPLRKKDEKKLSPKEIADQRNLQAKMTEYTQEAYTDAIQKHPFDSKFEFLRPIYAILEPYDFNIISQVKELCEKIKAEKEAKALRENTSSKKTGSKK